MNTMIRLINQLETITLFPFYLYKNGSLIYPSSSVAEELPLIKDPYLFHILSEKDGLIFEPDNSDIFYYACHYTNCSFVISGPFSILGNQKDIQRAYCLKHHLSNKFGYPVKRASRQQIIYTFDLLNKLLDNYHVTPVNFVDDIISNSFHEENAVSDDLQEYLLEENQYIFQSTPYILEKQMLEALQLGDEQTFYSILNQIDNYQQGQYASSSVKSIEYAAIMLISAFTRAVVDVGVSAREAYALSDMLCSKASHSTSLEQFEALIQDIYKQYFSLVKKKKALENMSPYISKSTSFIMRNLNQPLNPEIIADAVGISKDYLLHIFPQYLHCTVMDYIYRSRIEASCNMLKFSDYSIGRIAFYFQFKTQSHFSVVFKKYKGFSPAEYRKSNKPQNFK